MYTLAEIAEDYGMSYDLLGVALNLCVGFDPHEDIGSNLDAEYRNQLDSI